MKYARESINGFGVPDEWALSIVVPIFKARVTSGTAAAIEL